MDMSEIPPVPASNTVAIADVAEDPAKMCNRLNDLIKETQALYTSLVQKQDEFGGNLMLPALQSGSEGEKKEQHWKNPALFKTSICDHWRASGRCKFGARCWYAHGADEIRNVPRLAKEPKMPIAEKADYKPKQACPCHFSPAVGRRPQESLMPIQRIPPLNSIRTNTDYIKSSPLFYSPYVSAPVRYAPAYPPQRHSVNNITNRPSFASDLSVNISNPWQYTSAENDIFMASSSSSQQSNANIGNSSSRSAFQKSYQLFNDSYPIKFSF